MGLGSFRVKRSDSLSFGNLSGRKGKREYRSASESMQADEHGAVHKSFLTLSNTTPNLKSNATDSGSSRLSAKVEPDLAIDQSFGPFDPPKWRTERGKSGLFFRKEKKRPEVVADWMARDRRGVNLQLRDLQLATSVERIYEDGPEDESSEGGSMVGGSVASTDWSSVEEAGDAVHRWTSMGEEEVDEEDTGEEDDVLTMEEVLGAEDGDLEMELDELMSKVQSASLPTLETEAGEVAVPSALESPDATEVTSPELSEDIVIDASATGDAVSDGSVSEKEMSEDVQSADGQLLPAAAAMPNTMGNISVELSPTDSTQTTVLNSPLASNIAAAETTPKPMAFQVIPVTVKSGLETFDLATEATPRPLSLVSVPVHEQSSDAVEKGDDRVRMRYEDSYPSDEEEETYEALKLAVRWDWPMPPDRPRPVASQVSVLMILSSND
jgi:hypothetical protein